MSVNNVSVSELASVQEYKWVREYVSKSMNECVNKNIIHRRKECVSKTMCERECKIMNEWKTKWASACVRVTHGVNEGARGESEEGRQMEEEINGKSNWNFNIL